MVSPQPEIAAYESENDLDVPEEASIAVRLDFKLVLFLVNGLSGEGA